jgi:hypothetical protein
MKFDIVNFLAFSIVCIEIQNKIRKKSENKCVQMAHTFARSLYNCITVIKVRCNMMHRISGLEETY